MSKSQARLSYEIYEDYRPYQREWLEEVQINRDFYNNKQWTEREAAILRRRGQAPITNNRIYPACRLKHAQMRQHRPSLRATPVDTTEQEDLAKSELYTSLLQYVLQRNRFDQIDSVVKFDHIIDGIGYYHVQIDPHADNGAGEVELGSLACDVVFVDPFSKKPDFSDARHIVISQKFPLEYSKYLFPNHKRKLSRIAGADGGDTYADFTVTDLHSEENVILPGDLEGSTGFLHGDTSWIRIIERYSKIRVRHWLVTDPSGFFAELTDEEFKAGYAQVPGIRKRPLNKTKILKVVSAHANEAHTVLWTEVLPLDTYPIIPAVNVWNRTPFPYSDVTQMRGPQIEMNKARSLALLNMQSLNSPKWLHEEGAVDPRIWDKVSARPGQRLPYRRGYNKPDFVFSQALPIGMFEREKRADYDMQMISGAFSLSHGDSSQAPHTYSATLMIDEYGNRRLQENFDSFNSAYQMLGRVILQYAQYLYQGPKILRIMGEEGGATQQLLLNAQYMDQFGQRRTVNQIDDSKYDVIIEAGKMPSSNRMAMAQFAMELKNADIVDRNYVLGELDIPNKSDIMQRMDEREQLREQIKILGEALQDERGDNQTLRRMTENANMRRIQGEYQQLEKGEYVETAMKENLTRMRLSDTERSYREELRLKLLEQELAEREEKLKEKEKEMSRGSDKSKNVLELRASGQK